MFRITHVALHNICQYDNFATDINVGLTAVVGRNGAGKSTLLRAIVYGLTGLVDGLWGTQQSLQKDGTADIGHVTVSFTNGTTTYSVRRYSTSSVKFPDVVTCGNTVVATRRQAVNAFMDDVFGMPCALMFQVCWGRQGELAQLLKSTPAVISTFLSQMFDMKHIEKIRDKIKLHMDTISNLSVMCKAGLDSDTAELEKLPQVSDMQEHIDILQEELNQLYASIRLAEAECSNGITEAERDRRRSALESAVAECDRVLANKPDHLEPKESLPLDYNYNDQMMDIVAARSTATQKLKICDSILSSTAAELERIIQDRASCINSRDSLREKLNRSTDRCIICESEVSNKELYISKMCNVLTGYDTPELMEDSFSKRIDSLDNAQKSLEVKRSEAEQAIPELNKMLSDLNDLEHYVKMVHASTEYYNAEQRKSELLSELDALKDVAVISPDSASRLTELKQRRSEAGDKLKTELDSLASVRTTREMLEKSIQRASEVVRQYDINQRARTALAALREALSQNRAQARYLKAKIERLNTELSRFIQLTGMPFSVRLDPDRRMFVYITQDGYEHSAVQLSGAQQSMSAVALQMALLSMMQPNMNLYLIDEPTEALDISNKAVMASMFARMNSMMPAVDGVMMIVTRDEPVIENCNYQIEVGEQR